MIHVVRLMTMEEERREGQLAKVLLNHCTRTFLVITYLSVVGRQIFKLKNSS